MLKNLLNTYATLNDLLIAVREHYSPNTTSGEAMFLDNDLSQKIDDFSEEVDDPQTYLYQGGVVKRLVDNYREAHEYVVIVFAYNYPIVSADSIRTRVWAMPLSAEDNGKLYLTKDYWDRVSK